MLAEKVIFGVDVPPIEYAILIQPEKSAERLVEKILGNVVPIIALVNVSTEVAFRHFVLSIAGSTGEHCRFIEMVGLPDFAVM